MTYDIIMNYSKATYEVMLMHQVPPGNERTLQENHIFILLVSRGYFLEKFSPSNAGDVGFLFQGISFEQLLHF